MKQEKRFLDYFYTQKDKALFQDAEKVKVNDAYSLPYRVTGAIECWYRDHEKINTGMVFKLIAHVFKVGYLQGGRVASVGQFDDPAERPRANIGNIEDFLNGEALETYRKMIEWLTHQDYNFSMADEPLEGLKAYLQEQTQPGCSHLEFDDAATDTIASSFYIGYMLASDAGKEEPHTQKEESMEESPVEGMTDQERELIKKYRVLSPKGQQNAADYIEFMEQRQAVEGGSHE